MTTRPVQRNADLRAAYYGAAQRILSTEGYGGLKLAAVCRSLSVTTGSFYHSFDNWQEFTDGLLEHWLEQRTTLLVELARTEADPVATLHLLVSMASGLEHRVEAAIRVWAAVDPRVAEMQARVDHDRHAIVLESLRALVGDDLAPRYAALAMSTLVGFEMLPDQDDPSALAWSLETILASALAASDSAPDA